MNLLNIFRMNSLIQKLYPLAMVNKYAVNTYGKLNLVESKERISRISNLLCVQNLEENRYIRFGDSSDGGYVLANNISDRDVCISIGIGDNISFDRSISSLVSNIFMYDHTIAEIDHNIPNALFIRMGLSKEEKPGFIRLYDCVGDISDSKEIILKIDIEGDEWGIIAEVDEKILLRCKQIVIEFHHLQNFRIDEHYHDMISTLENLNKNHSLINIHPNNWANFDVILNSPIPDVVEVTYLRKDLIGEDSDYIRLQNSNRNSPNNIAALDIDMNFSKNL